MSKVDTIKAAALSEVGSPYVFGGTGQLCTPSYRRARIEQYPDYAAKITSNCQILSGRKSACSGCAWQGLKAYDCAQWTRRMLEKAGIKLPSGATNQWRADCWEDKGTINTIPADKVCCVFREDGARMGHVGLYMGDGSVTDARGHDYGVLHETLEQYAKWTHWALPKGLNDDQGLNSEKSGFGEKGTGDAVSNNVVGRRRVRGGRLALRRICEISEDSLVCWMPEGSLVDVLDVHASEGWAFVRQRDEGKQTGYCMAAYLFDVETEPDAPRVGGEPMPAGTVTLSREDAQRMHAILQRALEVGVQ